MSAAYKYALRSPALLSRFVTEQSRWAPFADTVSHFLSPRPTDNMEKSTEVLEKMVAEVMKYDYVRFSFADINCISRGKLMPSRNASLYLEDGVSMYAGKYTCNTLSRVRLLFHITAWVDVNLIWDSHVTGTWV